MAPQPRPLPLADNPSFGLVDPNPEPMTVVGTLIPFGYLEDGFFGDGAIGELPQNPPATLSPLPPNNSECAEIVPVEGVHVVRG